MFLQRVFTPDEIQYCSSRKTATQHYAGRWAVKVAVLRALGTTWGREIAWRNIETHSDPGGRTYVALSGEVAELADRLGTQQILITIAHCRTHAVGYAIAVGAEEE